MAELKSAANGNERKEWGSVLTFDTGDARTSPGQSPQDFAKFLPSRSFELTLRPRAQCHLRDST